MLAPLLTVLIVCVPYALANILLIHFFRIRRVIRLMSASLPVFALLIPIVYPHAATWSRDWLTPKAQFALFTGAAFAGFWYVYVQAYFIVSASITTSIPALLRRSGRDSVTAEELEELLAFRQILEHRLGLMVHQGLLAPSADGEPKLVPSLKCRVYGAAFLRVKRFLGLGLGG